MSKVYYVCQRAAQAIIAEIAPLRVSSDALQAVNLFIDEFILLLLVSASSLNLNRLKATVITLLPLSLGKNALVEAEIELKNQMDSVENDVLTNEKMQLIGTDSTFPLDKIIPVIQETCALYSTLADDSNNIDLFNNRIAVDDIIIAPVAVIYITTVIEHMAEYLLNSIAVTADQSDAEHVRVKEVLLTLLDDPQISGLFKRMNLKEKLEKRASNFSTKISIPIPPPVTGPISIKRDQFIQRHSHSGLTNSSPNINCNENEQGEEKHLQPCPTPSSNCSIRSSESINERPLSIISNGTVKSSGSKSRFNFFSSGNSGKKQKRHSISLNFSSKRSSSPSIISPTTPSSTATTMDFEELIRSGNTKKVTLTPNRLRSIEIKDEPTWDRASNTLKSTRVLSKKRSSDNSFPVSSIPPIPSLPHFNRPISIKTINNSNSSPPLTPVSSVASRPSQRSRHSIIYEEKSEKSSVKSCSTQEDETTSQLSRNGSKLSISSSLYSSRQSIQSSSEDDTIKSKNTPIERPSSIVAKRASMGSRPPSFHEGTIDITILMSNTTISKGKKFAKRTPYKDETFDAMHEPKTLDMVYVIPASMKKSSLRVSRLCSTTNKSHQIIKQGNETDEDEEWFLDEEELKDHLEEEKSVTGWLFSMSKQN